MSNHRENTESTDTEPQSLPEIYRVIDCEHCPMLFIEPTHYERLKAWLHSRVRRHEVWTGRREHQSDPTED